MASWPQVFVALDFPGLPWASLDFAGLPWTSPGLPWTPLDFPGLPWARRFKEDLGPTSQSNLPRNFERIRDLSNQDGARGSSPEFVQPAEELVCKKARLNICGDRRRPTRQLIAEWSIELGDR